MFSCTISRQAEYLEAAGIQNDYVALQVDISQESKPISKIVSAETPTTRKEIFEDDLDGDDVRLLSPVTN